MPPLDTRGTMPFIVGFNDLLREPRDEARRLVGPRSPPGEAAEEADLGRRGRRRRAARPRTGELEALLGDARVDSNSLPERGVDGHVLRARGLRLGDDAAADDEKQRARDERRRRQRGAEDEKALEDDEDRLREGRDRDGQRVDDLRRDLRFFTPVFFFGSRDRRRRRTVYPKVPSVSQPIDM